jgi:transposase
MARFDIVASTRRSWSREQKQAIVAEVEAPGASLSQVARRYGVHASLLFRWRRAIRAEQGGDMGSSAPVSPLPPEPAAFVQPVPRFVPVMLPPPDPQPASKPSPIEITIAGGRTVRVAADVDTAALVRIVVALETGR